MADRRKWQRYAEKKIAINQYIKAMANKNYNIKVINIFGLVCGCIANIASYKSMIEFNKNNNGKLKINRNYWNLVNRNFYDSAIIQWCIIFTESNGAHHWKSIFINKDEWKSEMLHAINISTDQYESQAKQIKEYRNMYVAHLDDGTENLIHPFTEMILQSSKYLYDYIINNNVTNKIIDFAYQDSNNFFILKYYDALAEMDISNIDNDVYIAHRSKYN